MQSRQINLERGSLPQIAVHPDRAATLAHNAVYGGQAQTSSVTQRLCRKEWFEDTRYSCSSHAAAGVGDRQHNVFARGNFTMLPGVNFIENDIRSANRQRAALRHGVMRVDRQVHHNLFDLSRIDKGCPQLRLGIDCDHHILPDESLQQIAHPRDHTVEVDGLGLADLLTAERRSCLTMPAMRCPAFMMASNPSAVAAA